jgi:hypothetical protein
MENSFNNPPAPQETSPEKNEMQFLREQLQLAEQQGNESEVLRLENEIRVIESGQQEATTDTNQESLVSQEQLPQKEKLAEEIMDNVEELAATLTEKDPKFYSEKAKVLLGRLGQVAGGAVMAGGILVAGGALSETVRSFIELDGPTYVSTGKAFFGAMEFTEKGEVVRLWQTIFVGSLSLAVIGGASAVFIEEKVKSLKNKMTAIKNKFQTA